MKKYIAGAVFLVFSFGLIGILSSYTPYLENLELKGYDFMKFLNIKGNFMTDRMIAELIESMPQATINR